MSFNFIIVDDEEKSIEALKWKISQVDLVEKAKVIGFTKGTEAIHYIKNNSFDLAFLDINMPHITGLELAEIIKEYKPYASVIFITGHDEYHLEALRLSAVDYIQKPFNLTVLKDAIDRFIKFRKSFKYRGSTEQEKIAVHHTDGISYFNKNEILYCSSEGNYSYIHLLNGEKILVSKTLKHQASLLGDDFYRIHHQFLVNLSYITQYKRGSGGSVTLTDGLSLPVSRRKKDELLILLGD